MHVLGARFESHEGAHVALRELRARFDLGERDAEVLPLGSTEYESPSSGLILAGRFREEVARDARALLERLGGTVFVHRDDAPLAVDTAWERAASSEAPAQNEVASRRASPTRERRESRDARDGIEAFAGSRWQVERRARRRDDDRLDSRPFRP
jgi:hypothetical protein